jgi:hypothetical protein
VRILLKVTSRGRHVQLVECVHKAITLSKRPELISIVYTFDFDDMSEDLNKRLLEIHSDSRFFYGEKSTKIAAINRNVPEFGWDILVNLSDDQMCRRQDWDDIIRAAMPEDLDGSLWYFDGGQMRINTMEIVGYNYYKRDNYIYHPEFKSFFCDNLATDVARKRNKLFVFENNLFFHEHPAVLKGKEWDSLYKESIPNWNHDSNLYERLKNEI